MVANLTSCVGEKHLVDVLLEKGIALQKVFLPEYGLRGYGEAGDPVTDAVDSVTGLPLVSLYGKTKKPTQEMLADVDVVVFDIQDVGVRCSTHLTTLHCVMEACATYQVPLVVLDRPNPNGHYVDGPVLDLHFQSFVGKHPIPLVHGLTLGELAHMINGEGWLQDGIQCVLKVIPLANYTHRTPYSLPIPPSSNLPNDQAVALYPSLVLFEGTTISTGRGTPFPFQVLGYPDSTFGDFQFKPISMPGQALHPRYQGHVCFGFDLRNNPALHRLDLQYLIYFYRQTRGQLLPFYHLTFDVYAGSAQLRYQLGAGLSEAEIRASWQSALAAYKAKRKKYLLYK
ncbi:MAG: DUF1343 domain-containing protein [Bacteroidota bacterium]